MNNGSHPFVFDVKKVLSKETDDKLWYLFTIISQNKHLHEKQRKTKKIMKKME